MGLVEQTKETVKSVEELPSTMTATLSREKGNNTLVGRHGTSSLVAIADTRSVAIQNVLYKDADGFKDCRTSLFLTSFCSFACSDTLLRVAWSEC
eukprot:5242159-Amphidinium_carterae.1